MGDTLAQVPMLAQAEKPKNPAAADLARQRAAKLSPERRRQIARIAAEARWAKEEDEEPEQPPSKSKKRKKKH